MTPNWLGYSWFSWIPARHGRPKNNVRNYASAESTAMSDKSFKRHRQGRRRRRVLRAAIGNVTPMSLIGTNRTNRAGLLMSVVRCRPEVAGRLSKRRTRSEHWPPRLELSLRSGLLTSGDNIRLERSNLFQEGLRLTELDLAAG